MLHQFFKNEVQESEMRGTETRLVKMLSDKIDVYLSQDLSGKEAGKVRAREYKAYLMTLSEAQLNQRMCEPDVLALVVKDVTTLGGGRLGTSTDLRKRLATGLCEYLDINKAEIQLRTAHELGEIVGTRNSGGTVDATEARITYALIKDRMNYRPMKEITSAVPGKEVTRAGLK